MILLVHFVLELRILLLVVLDDFTSLKVHCRKVFLCLTSNVNFCIMPLHIADVILEFQT